ncbi:dethiobiotin synthase [Natrinema pellirubrum DSM 15624]|uniref:ATP-dependent dethiobiotin synthetase BioD n=1 Tax=Natrinema pellirubrum (strain DSM 15624 / CIP 106293 / JCM 10476 / NCIMB 786 / 157) TaxID=797303 RepID=L0JKT9_NATP1|nr:dethiobiotin synthase [Natrinema pellirubrum]AGB31453.1 dethiobiotin synthase [Natrinema pellirubrum DSM 15624]ELY81994.1 dethiobiotin synthase [Natrinema pellirubrum DSM 15624]
MTRPLAVVGTGTGVGKTVVTAGLTRLLREDGHEARAIKPAQTGHPPDDDAGFVAAACDDPDAATCPRFLEPALAPRVAAEVADEDLAYEPIREACEREIDVTPVPIVEGIGGLRVPLAGDTEVIDLVDDLDAAAIVVTRSGLGTLNHTALSIDALEDRGIDVRGVVVNEYAGETLAERTNPDELERMTGHAVETVPPLEDETATPQELAAGVCDALSPAFRDRLPVDD